MQLQALCYGKTESTNLIIRLLQTFIIVTSRTFMNAKITTDKGLRGSILIHKHIPRNNHDN